MGATFKIVSWTPYKKRFDKIMLGIVALYLLIYIGSLYFLYPNIQPQLLIIKSTGSLAVLMIHFILLLGPLSRLNKKFLPILYNRRHLGVTMFFITLIHGVMSLLYYQGFGSISILESLFRSTNDYSSFEGFPFMTLGFFAFLILFVMAVTSHDFWLEKISPRIWKYLHMMVYLAYALIVAHVFTGALQRDVSIGMNLIYYLGVLLVIGLHINSAISDSKLKKERRSLLKEGFILVGNADDIPTDRAKVVNHKGQSIAVFKYDNKLSAVFNYCKHQGGPLGEGKILDGCITCPWHGFQYLPHNGQAPPPFNEKIATFDLKLVSNDVYLNPEAHPEGTEVDPLMLNKSDDSEQEDFFIGWAADVPLSLSQFLKRAVMAISIVAVIIAIALPNLSEELKDSEYTFGNLQEYQGTLHMQPVPRLTIGNEDHLLIDFGKFSASRSINKYEELNNVQLDNSLLKIEGTAISYNGRNLIELSNQVESIVEHNIPTSNDILEKTELGPISLKGEILDAKCFFGVMNPGDGPVHKFCAALCIQGGIPAVIFDEAIDEYYIIKGQSGNDINNELVPLAGEIVKFSGNSYSINNWRYIEVSSDINRLSFKNVLGEGSETLCKMDNQKPNQFSGI